MTLGPSQSVYIQTVTDSGPVTGVSCVASNDKGKWKVITPGSVTIPKSTADLLVQCTSVVSGSGQVSLPSRELRGKLTNFLMGGVVGVAIDSSTDARFAYPEQIVLALSAAEARDHSPTTPGMPTMPTAAAMPGDPPSPRAGADIRTVSEEQKKEESRKAESNYLSMLSAALSSGNLRRAFLLESNLLELYSGTALYSPELAIWYGKRAMARFDRLQDGGRFFRANPSELVSGSVTAVHEKLIYLLLSSDRLVEAEAVSRLLKVREFDAWMESQNLPRPAEVPFNEQEKRLAALSGAIGYTQWQEAQNRAEPRTAPAPVSAPQVPVAPPACSAVVRANPGVLSLQYVISDAHISILACSVQGATTRFKEYPKRQLERQITAHRVALENRLDSSQLSTDLWNALIGPVQDVIDQVKPNTLALNLSGRLRYVPFAALKSPAGRYLIEDHALSHWTPVVPLKPGATSTRPSVNGLGASQARLGQVALPSVRDELLAIVRTPNSPQGLLPGDLALDADFDESRLMGALEGKSSMLHIASHFSFSPRSASQSRLYLGTGNPLSVRRLGELDYSKLDLVTLSACETAKGGQVDEQGVEVEGLSAVLLGRGAKAVLGTLWKISDQSTAKLMTTFYAQKRDRSISHAAAMRAAQIDMLRGEDPALTAPFYWAAFVLSGDGAADVSPSAAR